MHGIHAARGTYVIIGDSDSSDDFSDSNQTSTAFGPAMTWYGQSVPRRH